jgi:predicted RNA-binding Zn-ribbon protein involved in translation (DUF1610 family)
MLRAIRKSDGEIVEAWSQKESAGPFQCPSCGGEVILRSRKRRLDHFAHAAERVCHHDLGESENHRRSKAEIWVCLKDAPRVADVQLERPLGEVRADVSATINGVSVAIEVQLSNLSVANIMRRTQEYTRRGIYVLWLSRWRPALDSGRYTPSHGNGGFTRHILAACITGRAKRPWCHITSTPVMSTFRRGTGMIRAGKRSQREATGGVQCDGYGRCGGSLSIS